MKHGRVRIIAALAVAPLLFAAACSKESKKDSSATTAPGAAGNQSSLHFAVVTHGGPGDSFWDVVKHGVEAAAKDLGVQVDYNGEGEAQAQAQAIDAAVSKKVQGIVVSMANPGALESSIKAAIAAGIPVITINSGSADSAKFGALAHVGQEETVAGQGAGNKLKAEGVKKLLCVIHEPENVGLQQRCDGAKETLGGSVEQLQVDGKNLAGALDTIKAKLQSDKSIDGVLTLNPGVAASAVTAAADAGSSAKIATFDLSGDVVSAIKDGKILFAIDQQQYLQGYLPIVMLKLYVENANTVGGGLPVLTGPGFVTKDNADKVEKLAKAGTR
jgi:simple sugar transport system substrate-binding protein